MLQAGARVRVSERSTVSLEDMRAMLRSGKSPGD